MLTLQHRDRELKIVWSLTSNASEDLADFVQIREIKKEALIERCCFYLLGKKEISLQVWRALLASLQILLDRHMKLTFICTDTTVEATLRGFGFYLLGEIRLEPTAEVNSIN